MDRIPLQKPLQSGRKLTGKRTSLVADLQERYLQRGQEKAA